MSDQLYFYKDLSPNAAKRAAVPLTMTELEKQAMERVRRARVKAPDGQILAFVRSVGPQSVLASKLTDIRAVANAF
jgi:hypothetical protein